MMGWDWKSLFSGGGRAAPPLSRSWSVRFSDSDGSMSYERAVREALDNGVAQRAIRIVGELAASAPLIVAGDDHEALSLVTPMLLETVASQLLLHGNAFIETGVDHRGRPIALWALRPDRVRVETDTNGWPTGWLYRVGNDTIRYPAEGDDERPGILHVKSFHPLDDHMGIGALSGAADSIALLNAASRWNRALLNNAARPSGALVVEGEDTLSTEQFDRLRSEIEAGFQGASNAGRPMLLEGGLKWQQMAMTPAEMDFAKLREQAAREVALALGVPPMLLGLPGDTTYANYAEANIAVWRLTILPSLAKILSALSCHLQQWWPGIRIEVDLDGIPALWSDRELLWRSVSGADFLTESEKREMLGFAPRLDKEGGE